MACIKCDPADIAPDIDAYLRLPATVPWFQNLGKPNPPDDEAVRIRSWEECHGPERGYGDWFGRWQSVIQERIEGGVPARRAELKELWEHIDRMVFERAAANVPLFDPQGDSWYGPTACVHGAAWTAFLVGWHILLNRRPPERLASEWYWYSEGHWPCDYAEEPPGHWDESTADLSGGKLLVY